MLGTLEQLAVAAAVVGVLALAGFPLTALALPESWRGWWPALLPIAGFISLVCVIAALNTFAAIDDLRVSLSLLLVVGAGVAVWRRPRPFPRPHPAAWGAVAVAAIAGLVAFAPSLEAGRATPPAIVSADAFYYVISATWLQGATSGTVPPLPDADSYFTPAFVAERAPLSLGAEQVDAAISTLLGIDPVTTFPAYVAVLVALACLAVALLLAALGVAPGLAALAVILVAARGEGLRLGLDTAVAQLCGAVTLPIVFGAGWMWISRGVRSWLAWTVLAAAALAVSYPGYLPFATVALGIAAVVAFVWSERVGVEGTRTSVALRVLAAAVGAILVAAPHLQRTADALFNVNSVSQYDISGFDSVATGLELLMGTGTIYEPTSFLATVIAVIGLAAAAVGLVALWRAGHAPVVIGLVIAVGIYLVRLRLMDPYPHGLRKFYDLPGPLLVGILCAAFAAGDRRVRVGVGAAAVVLAVAGVATQPGLVDRALSSPYSPTAAEVELRSDPRLFPDGRAPIALTGTSHDGVPMGRLHWAMYALRSGQLNPVSYDIHLSYLLSAVYVNPRVYVPQRGDEGYRPDYAYVLSWGPSPAHSDPYLRIGDYYAYRREPVDLVLAGWPWRAPVATAQGPLRWWNPERGAATIHVSVLEPRTARFSLRLVTRTPRTVRVLLDGKPVARARVRPSGTTVRTGPLALSAGRHDLALELVGAPAASPQTRDLGALRVTAASTLQR